MVDEREELPLLPFGNPIGFVPASRGGVYIKSINEKTRYFPLAHLKDFLQITHLIAALITCRAMEAQVMNIRRKTWTPQLFLSRRRSALSLFSD